MLPRHFLAAGTLLVSLAVVLAHPPSEHPTPFESLNTRETSCSGPVESSPKTWWRAAIQYNGTTPTAVDETFQYYRTVIQYGADNTGVENATEGFNFAINAWNRTANTVTTLPAYVYVPPGKYRIKASIQMLVSTYLIGDPLDPPTLIADPALGFDPVINGYDTHQGNGSATKNFYMSIRNIIIDTSEISTDTGITAIDWSVSQGCSMNNVQIKMPQDSKHLGITMKRGGSGIIIADCSFTGGAIGILLKNQQYELKGLSFNGCNTGIKIDTVWVATFQDITFANCKYGIDMSGNATGAVSLVDSSINNCEAGVNAYVSGTGQGSLTIDNFQTDGGTTAVKSSEGNTLLQDSVPAGQTWVMGNENPQNYQSGKLYEIDRPSALLSDDKYFTMPAPQYEKYEISQVVSLTNDSEYPVFGDNSHNDGPNINAILKKHAGCKIILVPQGIYVTEETIYIPPGTRLVGELLSVFTGNGSTFKNADDPKPVVQVGKPGEKGVAQILDILVEVSDILPGAILMQVNMAGTKPGDVGVWNTVLRVGGSKHTLVNTQCTDADTSTCKAAFALLHVTNSASLYAENLWGWVADHSLEDGTTQNIAVGRGALIESTQPTWLVGTSFEHCALYQYNLNRASNVYIGLQQTESPYWQGTGQPNYAPAPWTPNTTYGDPTFSNCADQDADGNGQCFRAWAHHAAGSSDIVIHGSALWVFFNGMNDNKFQDANCDKYGGICQLNMIFLSDAVSTFMYSLGGKSTTNLVYDTTGGDINVAAMDDNVGGWGAVVAAYLRDFGVEGDE
ncbi:pectate lyase superfamily protein-domain-containing protein [Pseudomassariella vexata]|uniref:Pectate lyase superfamily protein-domain-containing protein n=1 Tax=Pseudomassariella vexata TaxID=1141098 RepID=A0A1Y2EB51_9PEZI|nr:pectate lyase superfamily protein-domain-containing protein [Pseudomassariella vexata]ORY68799.1 pectate lyase superfamily protein-domain-containing protein [Pseudomassariella vexata]